MYKPTILDCAILSYWTYRYFTVKHLPQDLKSRFWGINNPINQLLHIENNLFSRLYLHHKEGEMHHINAAVIAYRGTQPVFHPENDISDYEIAIKHHLPLSYKDALTFFFKARHYVRTHYSNVPIVLTGHSLGGALAQLIAVKTGVRAIVFNSPGIGDLPDIDPARDYPNILNVNSRDGVINKIGKRIGQVEWINVSAGEENFAAEQQLAKLKNELDRGVDSGAALSTLMLQQRVAADYAQHRMRNMIAALRS